jgi:hypothetical protein
MSWRNLHTINVPVTKEMIQQYFRGLGSYIKSIIIDDDKKITLVGNTLGMVSFTKCPLQGWKNMWYGKKSLIDHIMPIATNDQTIVNMRFDIFSNSNSMNEEFLLHFIDLYKDKQFSRNVFPHYMEKLGIDNIYIGNFNTMFNLIYHFYYNLDDILSQHKVGNQEFLVFRENAQMNLS